MVENMAIEEIIEKDQNKDLTDRQRCILLAIGGDVSLNVPLNVPLNTTTLAEAFGVSRKTLQRDLEVLVYKKLIIREGGRKNGFWIRVKK